MDKAQAQKRLIDLKNEVDGLPKIKGHTPLRKAIQGKIDFMTRYKTEDSLNALMVRWAKSEVANYSERALP
jgi:hypothetical protein